MPYGTAHKYEIRSGELFLDRVLPVGTPSNYGYIPGTLEEDGDALDVFIYSRESIPPKTRVIAQAVALIRGMDNGVRDDKLVAYVVPNETVDVENVRSWIEHSLLPDIILYLGRYKKGFEVLGVSRSKKDIERAFKKSTENFIKMLEDERAKS
jgi:inorganic pyrophosphatase